MSRIVKQQRRYGCEWYLENDEGKVAWVAPMVKEHIERLEADNDKLRKKINALKAHGIEIVDAVAGGYEIYDTRQREVDRLEAENKELRELASTQYGVGMIPTQWVTHVLEDSEMCTLEINTSMTAVVCSKCNFYMPSGIDLLGVRYCPHCGKKVANAWS